MQKQYTKTGPIAFATAGADEIDLRMASDERVYIGSVEAGNSSGADAACGFAVKLPNAMWGAGQWDNSETGEEFVDDTADAQSAAADDFALSTLSANDGFVVYADQPFNLVGIEVGIAGGSAGVVEVTYFNGTAWAALSLHTTPAITATAKTYIGFHRPFNWATTDDDNGIPDGKYAIRVRYTTAPSTTAAVADSIWVAQMLDYIEAVGDGKSVVMMTEGEIMLPFTGIIIPFSSTANANNWINIGYRLS